MNKVRAKRNRTLVLSEADEDHYGSGLVHLADGEERDSELELLMSIAATLEIPSDRASELLHELMQDE